VVDRLIVAVALGGLAIAVAFWLQRGRAAPPTPAVTDFRAPDQLDRADFARPEAPWLVAVFTSATCSTCAAVWATAQVLDSSEVVVEEVEAVRDGDRHRRYAVEAVPIIAVADAHGVVRRSFLGPVSATHLWAALAELREPGSVPPGCDGHDHDHGSPGGVADA
jgi:hypothetical protein